MTKTEKNLRNSSFASIRKGSARNYARDTHKDENEAIFVTTIETLRVLGRVVRGIKARVEAYDRGSESEGIRQGNSQGTKPFGPACSQGATAKNKG
jgi:hypothetical protein